jgi:hypothetical protein
MSWFSNRVLASKRAGSVHGHDSVPRRHHSVPWLACGLTILIVSTAMAAIVPQTAAFSGTTRRASHTPLGVQSVPIRPARRTAPGRLIGAWRPRFDHRAHALRPLVYVLPTV